MERNRKQESKLPEPGSMMGKAPAPPTAPTPATQFRPQPPLAKQRSWSSSNSLREEAWLRRKINSKTRRSKSVTDEDLEELKACVELGFGFELETDSLELNRRLFNIFPALELYYAVNKQYTASTSPAETRASSPMGSPHTIIDPSEKDPEVVKTRLRHWAQVVACSVKLSPHNSFKSG